MAAPVHTVRDTAQTIANNIPLQDGYQSLVTLALNDEIGFFEKAITPPGYDGGDAVETTTMFNTTYRTFASRALATMTEMTITAAYDPILYTDILAAINRNDTITVTFPDGSQVSFYGYVKAFEPQEVVEGTQPEASVTIQPTNWDHANNVEAGPLVTEVAGT